MTLFLYIRLFINYHDYISIMSFAVTWIPCGRAIADRPYRVVEVGLQPVGTGLPTRPFYDRSPTCGSTVGACIARPLYDDVDTLRAIADRPYRVVEVGLQPRRDGSPDASFYDRSPPCCDTVGACIARPFYDRSPTCRDGSPDPSVYDCAPPRGDTLEATGLTAADFTPIKEALCIEKARYEAR